MHLTQTKMELKFINSNDVSKSLNVSIRTAQRYLKEIKEIYNVKHVTYALLLHHFGYFDNPNLPISKIEHHA